VDHRIESLLFIGTGNATEFGARRNQDIVWMSKSIDEQSPLVPSGSATNLSMESNASALSVAARERSRAREHFEKGAPL
jgi:hypothetical protein